MPKDPYDDIVAAAVTPAATSAPPSTTPAADPYDSIVAAAASPRQGKRSSASYDEDSALDLIAHHESGGRNIKQQIVPAGGGYNPSVGRVTGSSTASGPWQITDSTWRKRAPQDISKKYPTAMSAPVEVQRAVAGKIFRETGFQDWAPYNAGLRKAIARGEHLQRPQDPYDVIVSAADSPMGDTPKYGVAENPSIIDEPKVGNVPSERPQLVVPEGETPSDRFVADRTAAAGRPADEFTADPNTVDAPLPPFNKTYTGALGQIGDMGPAAQQAYLSFVRSNSPANAPSETVDKAANNDGLAKAFLQISDFVQKNPKASDKEVNRGLAKIGADFLRDPQTKGSQLPRALHDAMLSVHYTPDEWQQVPGKLQAQIKQAAAQRSAQKAQQVAQQKLAKFAKGRDVAADIQWHFGDEGLERFEQLNKRDQQEMISIALAAAFKDEAKKAAGTELTQDPKYQAEMRSRLPALAALENRPPKGETGDPFALLKSINAQPAPPSRDGALRAQAVRNTEAFTLDPVAITKGLYGMATKGVKEQFDAEAENEFQNLKAAEKRGMTPEMISARKWYGSMAPLPGQPNPRAIVQPLARTAAGLIKLAAGTWDIGGLFSEDDISKYLRTKAQFIEEAASLPPLNAAEEEVKRKLPEKTVAALMDTGLSIAEIIALKKASGIKSLSRLLALETALKTTGEPAEKRATQIIESATMGKILDKHLSRPASALLFGGPTAARQGQSYLAGDTSLEDALLQTGVQTGVGFALGGKPGEAKVGAVKEAGNAGTVKIQPEGRSSDTAHQGRADGGGLELSGGEQPGVRSRSPAKAASVETAKDAPAEAEVPRNEDVVEPEVAASTLTVAPKGETITPEKTDAEADGQVAAVPEPRRPTRPTVTGAETQISIPDSKDFYPARYAVREAEDVEASHNHQNFNPNENYHYTNDRNYAANSEYRMRVMERSGTAFDPREVVNTSPTLDTGPPAIDAEGNALGGNSRVMILKRVYDAGGEGAAKYKEEVMRQASLLGLDPEAVVKMDKPILVRELNDEKIDYQKAISNLNRPSAAPLTADEQSSAQAKQLRPEMADYIARKIEDMGEGGTVASMMDDHGADVINRMVDEGLISAPERNTLLKDGKATPEAKKRIERLLTSAVYRDAKHMEDTPPSVRANVERIAPSMMRLAGTEWDVKPLVQTALDALQEAKATGQTLAMLEGQPSLGREPYTAEELQMAKVLQMGPRKTADRFRGYADDHANFESGQGGLFGPPSTQAQSFETHFGLSPTGEKGGSVGARAPLNPVQPVTPPPAKPPKGATPPKPPAGPTLEEARKITRAPEPTRSVKDFVKSIPSWLQTNFTSEFTPLRDLERLVRKAAGKNAPDFDMARRFETLAGAGGIAEADLINFKKEVLAPVKHIADEFNDFLFLKRAEDRLTKDPDRKKVGTWDLAKVQKGLDELKTEITPAEYAKLEQAGRVYQQHMQRALYLQVESGRMTQGLYDKIIAENDFYAPFKLLKYLEETSSSPGTGRQIASIQDVTKAITGINEDDFGLRNLLQASADQIVRSRILAEKNMKMLALADLADVDAQSADPTDLIKHAKLTSYYPIDYKPAEEILHQLRLQETARNPQLLEQQMVKVGKAIEFAEAAGITVKQKNLPTSLGRAIIGQIKGGRISLKAFTSEVVSHEMGHVFDEATGIVRKKVFGTMRDVTQRHSSEINSQRVFQKELKDLTQYTQLGGGKKYQSSAKERYAEFISLYIHDPMKARQLAPNWTDFFEKNILPRAKVQRVIGSLADFFQKVDALPNIKSELQGMDNHNYLELAIRRAFPEKATQLGVAFGDKPGLGNEIIPYFKDGKPKGLEVSKEVAQAVQGLNVTQTSIVSKILMAGRTPLQFGATSANLGFQVVNYVSADQMRTLISSRYGLQLGAFKTPVDAIRYPLDAIYSFYTSVAGNVFGKHNPLFMDWLKSGAANSTIQRELTPESFKQTLGIEKKTVAQKVRGSGRFVLDTVAKLSNAVEEATKITTLKRGLRFEGADKMTPEQRREVIETRITPEVRNYGGSPDFSRHGAQMRQLNLLMMFLNARVQGSVSDLARLSGKTGSKEGAAAWGRMSTLVGLPTLLLGIVNTMPVYRKDYDKVPQWEKDNYWMIPRESFFTDEETGEPVRDYWRIPKRDIFQTYANLIENGVLFARDQTPEAAERVGMAAIENLSPLNIEGKNLHERTESMIGSLNPVMKTPIEVGLNRDTFRHRPIVPDYMKDASSEKQYRATTPKPYVAAGNTPVAKALGMSPLEIEHIARATTGDAAGQFTLRPAEAGRNSFSGYPVIRRFVRSGAIEPNTQSNEAMQKSEQHQADTKIDRRRVAYGMISQWDKQKLSPQEREAQIRETAKTDSALADDLIRYSESRILTSQERRLRTLGIENGERAQFLVDEIARTSEDKRDAYVSRLKDLHIITRSVESQMHQIEKGKQPEGKKKAIRTRLRNFSQMEKRAGRYNVTQQ